MIFYALLLKLALFIGNSKRTLDLLKLLGKDRINSVLIVGNFISFLTCNNSSQIVLSFVTVFKASSKAARL